MIAKQNEMIKMRNWKIKKNFSIDLIKDFYRLEDISANFISGFLDANFKNDSTEWLIG